MGDRMELWPSSARKFAQETMVEKMQQAEKIRRLNEAIEALTAECDALRARLEKLAACTQALPGGPDNLKGETV